VNQPHTQNRANEEALLRDARARIIWGEAPEEVAQSLQAAGVDRWQVAQEVKRFTRERANAIRCEGVGEMWKGAGIFLAAVIPNIGIYLAGYVVPKLLAIGGAGALYGIYRFVHGLVLATTGRMRGSLS
jgi:hypothetical protein